VDRLFRQLDVAGTVAAANDERLDVRQRRCALAANLKKYIKDQDLGWAGQGRAGRMKFACIISRLYEEEVGLLNI
jgi:hypothetical protein